MDQTMRGSPRCFPICDEDGKARTLAPYADAIAHFYAMMLTQTEGFCK
mgnify:CR=1 FL=1